MQGWPPGEALTRAMSETVEWAMLPVPGAGELRGPSHSPLESLGRDPASKRAAETAQALDGVERPPKKPAQPPGPPPTRDARTRQQTVTTLKGNKTLCKAFNDDRACQRVRVESSAPTDGTFATGSSHRAEAAVASIVGANAPSPEWIHLRWLRQGAKFALLGMMMSQPLLSRVMLAAITFLRNGAVQSQLFDSREAGQAPRRVIRSGGSVEKGEQPSSFRYCAPSEVHARLEAAKPVAWRGRGELPTFAWSSLGTWLVIDLWSGIGGTIFSCLSLGLWVYAIAIEQDPDAAERTSRSFPNVISLQLVEEFHGSMIRAFLKRRTVEGVIVGGCPRQGHSDLSRHRCGEMDSRSHQPQELRRICSEIEGMPEAEGLRVCAFIEDVAIVSRCLLNQFWSERRSLVGFIEIDYFGSGSSMIFLECSCLRESAFPSQSGVGQ